MKSIEVVYLPQHRDSPLFPKSAEELVGLVEGLIVNEKADCSLMWIILTDDADEVSLLFVGMAPGESAGCLLFQGEEGEFYSKGLLDLREPQVYYDFGNARYFPSDSKVGMEEIRRSVTEFYLSSGRRPRVIEWQDCSD